MGIIRASGPFFMAPANKRGPLGLVRMSPAIVKLCNFPATRPWSGVFLGSRKGVNPMQFQLPANLREQVAVYDPALKAMIAAQKAANNPKKKSTTPLGLPTDLFPVEVLSTEDQTAIAQRINGKAAPDRYQVGATENHAYLVYHHESMWVAAWCLTTHDDLLAAEVPYIYGMTVAYKAAASTASKINRLSTGNWDRIFNRDEDMTEVKYGRTMFLKRTKLFTLTDIQSGDSQPGWIRNLRSWGTNSGAKHTAARTFAQAITTRIPIWSTSDIFERIVNLNKPVANAVIRHLSNRSDSIPLTVKQINSTIELSYRKYFDTPYFRREAQQVVERVNTLYHDRGVKDLGKIREPYVLWKQQIEVAQNLIYVYKEETPTDYLQKMYEIGRHIRPIYNRERISKWFKAHLPIASFVGWFEKYLGEKLLEWKESPTSRGGVIDSTGQPTTTFYELSDTINMMQNLWERQTQGLEYSEREAYVLQMTRPSRWRLSELHDHVSAQLWLAGNKNEDLPQDLFPTPIKINHLDSVWTFFQPRDIHQLGQWGQAVRNCVGNASNYREGVKKRSHFIVLAMIDQKPRFTVQLKVRNGVLEVDQIADIGNRRLDDTERSSYELTFSHALKTREAQLLPGAEVEA